MRTVGLRCRAEYRGRAAPVRPAHPLGPRGRSDRLMLEGPAAILARLSSGTPLLSLDGKTGSQLTRVQAEGHLRGEASSPAGRLADAGERRPHLPPPGVVALGASHAHASVHRPRHAWLRARTDPG